MSTKVSLDRKNLETDYLLPARDLLWALQMHECIVCFCKGNFAYALKHKLNDSSEKVINIIVPRSQKDKQIFACYTIPFDEFLFCASQDDLESSSILAITLVDNTVIERKISTNVLRFYDLQDASKWLGWDWTQELWDWGRSY